MSSCIDGFMEKIRKAEESIKQNNKEIEEVKGEIRLLDTEGIKNKENIEELREKITDLKKVLEHKKGDNYARELSRKASEETKKEMIEKLMKMSVKCEENLGVVHKKVSKDISIIETFSTRYGFARHKAVMEKINETKKEKLKEILNQCESKHSELDSRKQTRADLEELKEKVVFAEKEVKELDNKRNHLNKEYKELIEGKSKTSTGGSINNQFRF